MYEDTGNVITDIPVFPGTLLIDYMITNTYNTFHDSLTSIALYKYLLNWLACALFLGLSNKSYDC